MSRIRRVLHSGDPRGADYLAAEEWAIDIRSRLVQLRGELEDLGRIEARFEHDRLCGKVAGSLTLAIIALHSLQDGERSFGVKGKRADALWAEAARDPDAHKIVDGTSWDWRALGIFKRGGRA